MNARQPIYGGVHPTLADFIRPFAPPQKESAIGKDNWNDDDLYVVDLRTKSIVTEIGSKNRNPMGESVQPGQCAVTGMQAKNINWGQL